MGNFWFLGVKKKGIKIYVLEELKSPGIKNHTKKYSFHILLTHSGTDVYLSAVGVFKHK